MSKSDKTYKLTEIIEGVIRPLGFQLVDLEVEIQKQKVLRVFIEKTGSDNGVTVDDCAKVAKALDEPLETSSDVSQVFKASYELEVSSPGIDRPLRKLKDFERFEGNQARIHTFRPLTAEEMENKIYQQSNPKQKNYLGLLQGTTKEKVVLHISKSKTNVEIIKIPHSLISKANLEPDFKNIGESLQKKGVEKK